MLSISRHVDASRREMRHYVTSAVAKLSLPQVHASTHMVLVYTSYNNNKKSRNIFSIKLLLWLLFISPTVWPLLVLYNMGGWNWVSGFSKKIRIFFPPPKNREKYSLSNWYYDFYSYIQPLGLWSPRSQYYMTEDTVMWLSDKLWTPYVGHTFLLISQSIYEIISWNKNQFLTNCPYNQRKE